ncbi:MAG: class A beta-lactamase [Pseudomonadota bacterium]
MRRFQFLAVGLLLLTYVTTGPATPVQAQSLTDTVKAWERELDARIGVLLYEVGSGLEVAYRANERFAMSSTFKPLLCGAILAGVDAGTQALSERVTYQSSDLVDYSPVTSKHVETGMTVGDLCKATITISDNTAANLLLQRIGGPSELTSFLRTTGDSITRLDRRETALNQATPGDPRDTTTPRAILETLERLLDGTRLSPASAAQLRQWMIEDQVADELIRPHVPEGWTIGDKTGAGGHGNRAIIAFLQTPEPGTYLAAIYLTETSASFAKRNAVISEIGRAMIAEIDAHAE